MLTELHTNPTQLVGLLAFAVAALACARTALLQQRDSDAAAWRALAATQLAFWLEILLSLRHRLHAVVEIMFSAHGWYAQRSALQVPLVCVALLLTLVAIWALLRPHGVDRTVRAAMAASAVALGSLVVEAISLHTIDLLMYATVGPLKLIAFVWAASATAVAVMAIRAAPRRGGTPPAFRR